MSQHTLLIATANPHKLTEITQLLGDLPDITLKSLRDFPNLELPPEDGLTMRDNARIKADYCAQATGLPSIADDSGIEVDALNGAPGLYSARWFPGSDADRTKALLDQLIYVPIDRRTARYRCAICVTQQLSTQLARLETEGTCEGIITDNWRGSNGFGYDPIFEITPATAAPESWIGYTLAQVPPEVKAQISHRARAITAVKPQLLAFLDSNG